VSSPILYAVSDVGNTTGARRLDLKAAASALGVTSEAVRRRAKRGTLASEKGPDGKLYVWVPNVPDDSSHDAYDGGGHMGDTPTNLPETLLDRFEDENGFLRREVERLHRELERKDAILMTMAQRIPELESAREPPPEPRESPLSASEEEGKGETNTERRSWWRRFFGF
jgi:hypothetical protein